jgi:hypothetical protein
MQKKHQENLKNELAKATKQEITFLNDSYL